MSEQERIDAFSIRQLGFISGDRLPIIANIRVGEKVDDANLKTGSRPKALDHFKVFSPDLDAKKRRIIHREITKWLNDEEGERPRRFPIMFLHNEKFDDNGALLPSDNFVQYLGMYTGRKCVCRGDGGNEAGEPGDAVVMQEIKTKAGKVYERGTIRRGLCPCSNFDAAGNAGACKPHTIVGGIPRTAMGRTPIMTNGGIVVLRSGGIMTATAIKSGFTRFARLTNGWLAYLPFYLVVQMRPGQMGNVPVVHLESPLSDDQLVAEAQRRAHVFLQQGGEFKRIQAAARNILLIESPAVQADVNEEFSPATAAAAVTDVLFDDIPAEIPVAEKIELSDEEAAQDADTFFQSKGGELFE
jgi:hypothetical protein